MCLVSRPFPSFQCVVIVFNHTVSESRTAAVVSILMTLITHLQSSNEVKQRNKAKRIVGKLVKAYLAERLGSPQARARALWVAGTYAERGASGSGEVEEWAPDVLRIAVRGFVKEVRLDLFTKLC